MTTYILMGILILFYAFLMLFKAKLKPDCKHFFDKDNTNAMRGFCCLMVIMVHAPYVYHNKISDLIGSFGFIVITFYFMTSGYGLKFGINKRPESIRYFWRNRLPKLLVPMLIGNVFVILAKLIEGAKVNVLYLFHFNNWVIWLLVCYLIFWLVYRFINIKDTYRDIIISVLILAGSITVYFLKENGIISVTTWCTEVFGFVWGIALSHMRGSFSQAITKSKRSWIISCLAFCGASGILGIAYLKFKPVAFFGDYVLKIFLGIAIILLILALNCRISFGNKLSAFLGSISYETYLMHMICYELIEYFAPTKLSSGIFIFTSFFVTIAVAYIVYIISNQLNKPIMKLIKKTY